MTDDDADGVDPPPPTPSDGVADADSWVEAWARLQGETVASTEPSPAKPPAPSRREQEPPAAQRRPPAVERPIPTPVEAEPTTGPGSPDLGVFALRPGPPEPPGPTGGDWPAPTPDGPAAADQATAWPTVEPPAGPRPGSAPTPPPARPLPARSVPARRPARGSGNGPVQPLGLVAGGLLAVFVGLTGYLFLSLGQSEPDVFEAKPEPTEPELSLTVGAAVPPATVEELTASTVQIVGLDDAFEPQCAGSGVIVSTDGTILTNAHVVRSTDDCRFTEIGVAITTDPTLPPDLLYLAEVDLVRPAVDLAVLRLVGPLPGRPDASWPQVFRPAPLGDSDTVSLGDPIRILGYPVIGGDTITLTTGTVSGFTSQAGLGSQALIKTDASISAGNSGGLAVDAGGRVIGIPTKARASDTGPAVDCRAVDDTNADGVIDGDDSCVTVGGFLNGIRPINLSLPLLAAAGISDPAVPGGEDLAPRPPLDLEQVALFNPRFALGVSEDDSPIDEVLTASAGIPELCFFVDWDGIPAGAGWDGVWYIDNQAQVGRSAYTGRIWERDESGQYFWLCIEAEDEGGLPAGVYEIALFLAGTVAFVEGIEITPEPVELVSVVWINETGVELCGLAHNPQAQSLRRGLNELPVDQTIPPEGEWTMELPAGRVLAEAFDCQGNSVAYNPEGLVIDGPKILRVQPEG